MNTFSLEIDWKKVKHHQLLKDIINSNLKLPNMKRVKIDNLTDNNTDLISFFENWIPDELEFLCINWDSLNEDKLKMGYCNLKNEIR